MNDTAGIPSYPWKEGDTVFASALNAAIANAGSEAGGAINVLGYGADPTGVADSTAAIRGALAIRPARSVYLPAGTYRITDSLTVGSGSVNQTLYGDGSATVLVVNADFNPAAAGVLLIPGTAVGAPTGSLYTIRDLQVVCTQPPDFVTTTTAAASTGTTTLTLASATGVRVGNYAYTAGDMVPACRVHGAASATVTNIAGNVVTFSLPLTGNVTSGQTIYFAPARAQYAPLGTAISTVGGTGVKYPWVINVTGDYAELRNLMISSAWDGVRIRGSACVVDHIRLNALDVGYDFDQCYAWHRCDNLEVWAYGMNGLAGQQTFYDGQTIAANFGEVDGMTISGFGSWTGIVNLTANWTWGQIGNLGLDGDHAVLNAIGASSSSWLEIGNFYNSHGKLTTTPGINVMGPMRVSVGNASIGSDQESVTSAVSVSGGELDISGGYILGGGTSAAHPVISVTGGRFSMSDVQANYGGAGGVLVAQTGPNGVVQVRDIALQFNSPTGLPAITIATDNAQNVVRGVSWNGWTFTAPGNLGYYEPSQVRPYSQQGGMTASGTNQATATPITAVYSNVNTTPAGSGVIMPGVPRVSSGTRWVIWNHGANALNVYPAVGEDFINQATNVPIAVAAGAKAALVYWGSLWLQED